MTALADLENINTVKDRMTACLYGQAIGDALGLGTEFMSCQEVMKHYPTGLKNYDQIIHDSHRRRWAKGAWTDDTDMMLCVLRGFENGTFNPHAVAQNFKDWFNGTPTGIGSHTFKVLCTNDYVQQPELCSKLWWEVSRRKSAANGALMRTCVVGLVGDRVEEQAEAICKLTHYDSRCVGSCVIVSCIIHNLVYLDRQLSYDEISSLGNKYDGRIAEWIVMAYNSSDISLLDLDECHSMGYTLRALSAALWCYWHAESFENGLLTVVNEGGDADSNAAIASAILGAKFGSGAIPRHYIAFLHNGESYRTESIEFINRILNDESVYERILHTQ